MDSSRALTRPIPTLGQVGTPRQLVGLQRDVDSNIRQLARESTPQSLSPQAHLGALPYAVLLSDIEPFLSVEGAWNPDPI